jgi:hypothetical protein
MDSLLGKSKDDVIMAVGVPNNTTYAGSFEVLVFYRSYGKRAQAQVAPNPYLTTASGSSWEAYDSVNAYFKDGVMVKWDGYVQR